MSGRFYSTANWKRIRARQLAREPMCQYCAAAPAVEVDHRVRINAGGSKRDPDNLASTCRECHAKKTTAERLGKHWTPPVHRGCYEDGTPRDPKHPWNQQVRGDQSPGAVARDRWGHHETELVVAERQH